MTNRFVVAAAAFATMTCGAWAADLPNTKGPPEFAPPPPPAFSWTGFYIGGQVGYQWGESDDPFLSNGAATLAAPEYAHNDEGVVGGAHAGYNLQFDQFVVGVEGDVDGSSYEGSVAFGPTIEKTEIPIEGSFRGRLGFAFDRVLIYGTGGLALASVEGSFSAPTVSTLSASGTQGRAGWTAGGGIEYAITNNWSVSAEYRYIDLGRATYSFAGLGLPDIYLSKRITKNIATVNFSYKFDMFAPPAPVVAKY